MRRKKLKGEREEARKREAGKPGKREKIEEARAKRERRGQREKNQLFIFNSIKSASIGVQSMLFFFLFFYKYVHTRRVYKACLNRLMAKP